MTSTGLEVEVLGSTSVLLLACSLALDKPLGLSEPKFLIYIKDGNSLPDSQGCYDNKNKFR